MVIDKRWGWEAVLTDGLVGPSVQLRRAGETLRMWRYSRWVSFTEIVARAESYSVWGLVTWLDDLWRRDTGG